MSAHGTSELAPFYIRLTVSKSMAREGEALRANELSRGSINEAAHPEGIATHQCASWSVN